MPLYFNIELSELFAHEKIPQASIIVSLKIEVYL